MNAFHRVRSLVLALLVSTWGATVTHAAESTASDDPDQPGDAIHELDKMIISEKAEGIVPLLGFWQFKLTGRLIIAPVVPPPAKPGENFSLSIQSHPRWEPGRNSRFSNALFRGTPENHGFVSRDSTSKWVEKNSPGFPPELTIPGGGQIVAIDGQDVWECNGYTLRKLWEGGPVGAPVTLVIQGANEDQCVFRQITLKRISKKKWLQLLKGETPPSTAELPAPPAPAP